MIVCSCNHFNTEKVKETRASTIRDVFQRLGCEPVCCSCFPAINEIISTNNLKEEKMGYRYQEDCDAAKASPAVNKPMISKQIDSATPAMQFIDLLLDEVQRINQIINSEESRLQHITREGNTEKCVAEDDCPMILTGHHKSLADTLSQLRSARRRLDDFLGRIEV